MEVIALVGASGTGKSHRALSVAYLYNADAIIDDGILIEGGKIIAGYSAKEALNRVMAVKRAIFVLPGHAQEVIDAIDRTKPHRVLVLATSEKMAHRIVRTLLMPPIHRMIHIEDIASQEEIQKARFYRLKQGKHIIPIPTIELKHHFSAYLVSPLQTILNLAHKKHKHIGEKSIVRPVFSYYGRLSIEDSAIVSIVKDTIRKYHDVSIHHVSVNRIFQGEGISRLEVNCEIAIDYGIKISSLVTEMQNDILEAVEFYTGMIVHEVNIYVETLNVSL